MISETLVFLSVISAIAAVLARPLITTRFAVGFLGLFSSLVAYLRGENPQGLVLLLASTIILPCILASRFENIGERPKNRLRMQLYIAVLYPIAAFMVGILMRLEPVEAGLAALASVGLATLTLRGSSLESLLGLIVVSQAVLVAVSLRNPPLWLILSSEFCRLSCIAFVPFSGGQRSCQE